MTEVQVYDGEGPTPEHLLDEMTALFMSVYPDLFPPEIEPTLKAKVLFAMTDIVEERKKDIIAEGIKDKITDVCKETTDEAMMQGLEPDEFAERLVTRLKNKLTPEEQGPRPGVFDWSQLRADPHAKVPGEEG